MSEEKKVRSGCELKSLEYDPMTKCLSWESILSSNLKCDAWEIGPYTTRVDGKNVPLDVLVKGYIVQYLGVRKINAPLKRESKAEAQKALTNGFDWADFFTREAKKLSPVEQARSSVSKITELDELNKLLAEVQAKVAELSKSGA